MIEAIRLGIYNLITSNNAFNTSLGGNAETDGRFYWQERPSGNPVYPFAVGFLIFAPVTRNSENVEENIDFQLSIFQDEDLASGEYIDALSDKATALLDDSEASLSFVGYNIMRIERVSNLRLDDTDNIKQRVINYEIQVQKQ